MNLLKKLREKQESDSGGGVLGGGEGGEAAVGWCHMREI